MRIIQLTPGTGNFYCGNCVRDNALVTALCELGHDVLMLPLYLPMLAEEPAASNGAEIFYGGINVYLQQKSALFRHTPRWLDRIFDSKTLLNKAAARAGMTRAKDLGAMTVSMLRGEEGLQLKELERLIAWLRREPPADLISLSNVLLIGMARRLKAELRAPLVCTMQGEDGFLDSLVEPHRGQAWALLAERARDVDLFIPVSHYFGNVMAGRMRLRPEQLRVVYNGVSTNGYPDPLPARAAAMQTGASREFKIGFLSRLCRAKGLATLVDAFIQLRTALKMDNVTLRLAGSMTPSDEPYVELLRRRWYECGLDPFVSVHPNLSREEKIEFLLGLDVLSVPATYGEAFGLYVVEALLAGVPVVQPRHAVFPELEQALGGVTLCAPDDPAALAGALASVLNDPAGARKKALAGRERALQKFTARNMAENFIAAVEPLLRKS